MYVYVCICLYVCLSAVCLHILSASVGVCISMPLCQQCVRLGSLVFAARLSPVNNVTLFELDTIFVEACVLWARNPMFPVPSGWAGCHRYLRSIKDNLMNLTQK